MTRRWTGVLVVWTPETPVPDPAVREIFPATVLPGRRYPELTDDGEQLLENSFEVPDAALAGSGLHDLALEHLLANGHSVGWGVSRSLFLGWLKASLAPTK